MDATSLSMSLPLELQSFGIPCGHTRTPDMGSRLRRTLHASMIANLSHDPFFGDNKPDYSTALSAQQQKSDDSEYLDSARGRPCGHIFGKHETVYRCRTCGMDDTCVMCQVCYRASNHEGHDIAMSLNGGSGGCCDCGDAEAWKVDMRCKYHHADVPVDLVVQPEVPGDIADNIRSTVRYILDFILDVMSHARDSVKPPCMKDRTNPGYVALLARLKGKSYNENLEAALEVSWSTVLWNDEKHNFDEVIAIVRRACDETTNFGLEIATLVDSRGRATVYTGEMKDAIRIAKFLSKIRLGVTVRCSRDIFREDMVEILLGFLQDMANFTIYLGDGLSNTSFIRNVICEELCKPWLRGVGPDEQSPEDTEELVPMVDSEDDDDADEDDEIDGDDVEMIDAQDVAEELDVIPREIENNLWDQVALLPREQRERLLAAHNLARANAGLPAQTGFPLLTDTAILEVNDNPRDDLQVTIEIDGEVQTVRLPPVFDRELDSGEVSSRNGSDSPIWPTVHASDIGGEGEGFNPPYWRTSCVQPAQDSQTRLTHLFLLDLRLWKMARAALRELYITTMVAIPEFKREMGIKFAMSYKYLTEAFLFADREPEQSMVLFAVQIFTVPSIALVLVTEYGFLTTLLAVCYTYYSERKIGSPSDVNTVAHQDSDVYSFRSRRHYHIVNDLRWLLRNTAIQRIIPSMQKTQYQFLDWLELFQGQNPQKKAVGDHVEYESMTYNAAFGIMMQVAKQAQWFARTFEYAKRSEDGTDQLARILKEASDRLHRWATGGHRLWRPEFEPLESPLEHISLHHPLHWLLVGLSSHLRDDDVINFLPSVDTHFAALFRIAQYPLKVIHTIWEARSNLWVRNGQSIQWQVYRYTAVDLREYCIDKDVQFVQLLLAAAGPSPRRCDNSENNLDILKEQYSTHIANHDRIISSMMQIFHSVPGPDYMGTDASSILMQDYMFQFLIVLFSERAWLLKKSEEEDTRRAIRHGLIFGPRTFSEISKTVNANREDEASFTTILASLTNFRPPVGLDDVGHFVLKEEEFENIDPYHHHYTLQQVEEANDILKQRGKKNGSIAECKLESVPHAPWGGVFDFVFCRTIQDYIQIYFSSLLSAAKSDPRVITLRDSVTDKMLHLLVLSLQAEEIARNQGCATITQLDASLFQYYLETDLQQNSALKAHSRKLNLFYDRLSGLAGSTNNSGPASRRSPNKREHVWDDVEAEDADFARKKALAKARQAKLMSDMKASQEAFLDRNSAENFGAINLGDQEADTSKDPERPEWHFPAGNCLICQNAVQIDGQTYGVLGSILESRLDRMTPAAELLSRGACNILSHPLTMDTEYDWQPQDVPEYPTDGIDLRHSITTCGHIMHWNCYTPWLDGIRIQPQNWNLSRGTKLEFQCPLCKSVGNTFLPVFSRSKPEQTIGILHRNDSSLDSRSDVEGSYVVDPYTAAETLTEDMNVNMSYVERAEMLSFASRAGKSRVSVVPANDWDTSFSALKQFRESLYAHRGQRYSDDSLSKTRGPFGSFSEHAAVLSSSIADIEIALRDKAHNDNKTTPVATLVDGMSEQNIISLRVQTNVIQAYQALDLYRYAYDGPEGTELFMEIINHGLKARFHQIYDNDGPLLMGLPLIEEDNFSMLVEISLACVNHDFNIGYLANTLLLAEMFKVLVVYKESIKPGTGIPPSSLPELDRLQLQDFRSWCGLMLNNTCPEVVFGPNGNEYAYKSLYGLMQRSALVFVRRYALFAAAVYNIRFPVELNAELPNELVKLSSMLKVAPLEELLSHKWMCSNNKHLAMSAHRWAAESGSSGRQCRSLPFPLPFKLTRLPHALDELFERCQYYKCARCKTVPNSPAICLLCGTIVCFQSQCCSDSLGAGECTTHRQSCGGTIGLYLIVKRCILLVMRNDGGAFGPVPYLDIHGERDPDLLRGKPQFLNARRYEVGLRQMYIHHQVGTWIARKLENTVDMGGWETL